MSCNEHLEPRAPFVVDPEALKVREWRHKLQKAFLNTRATPKEDDMPVLDQLFTLVETYDNMRIEYLTFSKIGKVMRHIYALGDDKVPRDAEFRFRARAGVLVDRWHDVLRAADGAPAADGACTEDGPASASGRSEGGAAETVLRAADGAPESTPAAGGARTEDGPASTNGELGDGATETKADGVAAVEVDADADTKGDPEPEPAEEEESADAESKLWVFVSPCLQTMSCNEHLERPAPFIADPEALKVREWRHKLQKAFLNTKATPKEDDMPSLDQLFTLVETYDNMRTEYLTFSKIGKVMRHIQALGDDTVPRDGEFRFRARAGVLVDRWHDVLKAAGGASAADGARREDSCAFASGKSEDGAAETNLANGVAAMRVDADAGAKGEAGPVAEEESADAESGPAPALVKINV